MAFFCCAVMGMTYFSQVKDCQTLNKFNNVTLYSVYSNEVVLGRQGIFLRGCPWC